MRRVVANSLIVLGVLCLGAVAWVQVQGAWLAGRYRLGGAPPAVGRLVEPGTPIGWIDIPRVGVSALVREGTAEDLLLASVGHVPGTALPGEPGNSALAGHRDSFFRDLEHVEPGDEIRLEGADGVFLYRVVSTAVVGPERTDLLAPGDRPLLTLVTCYPFRWVGPAPKRFVVQAELTATGEAAAGRAAANMRLAGAATSGRPHARAARPLSGGHPRSQQAAPQLGSPGGHRAAGRGPQPAVR